MTEKTIHLFDTLTDSDWQLVSVALQKLGTARSQQLSQDFLAWRISVNKARAEFLKALQDIGK